MNDKRRQLGQEGEALAVTHLKKKGYRILEQNFRAPTGEIDIIARQAGVIVFIEVKTRKSISYGNPKYAVTRSKQLKIVRTAQVYLKKTRQMGKRARFDVVAIHPREAGSAVEIIPNAFDLTGLL